MLQADDKKAAQRFFPKEKLRRRITEAWCLSNYFRMIVGAATNIANPNIIPGTATA